MKIDVQKIPHALNSRRFISAIKQLTEYPGGCQWKTPSFMRQFDWKCTGGVHMKYYWYYYLDGQMVSTAPNMKCPDGIIGRLNSAGIRHLERSTDAHSPIPAVSKVRGGDGKILSSEGKPMRKCLSTRTLEVSAFCRRCRPC